MDTTNIILHLTAHFYAANLTRPMPDRGQCSRPWPTCRGQSGGRGENFASSRSRSVWLKCRLRITGLFDRCSLVRYRQRHFMRRPSAAVSTSHVLAAVNLWTRWPIIDRSADVATRCVIGVRTCWTAATHACRYPRSQRGIIFSQVRLMFSIFLPAETYLKWNESAADAIRRRLFICRITPTLTLNLLMQNCKCGCCFS